MKLELCAGNELAIRIAHQLSFARIELCQQLEIGGITPSFGLQEFSKNIIETHVLIRPRGGNFDYNADEKEVILKDIHCSKSIGIHGIVIGALNQYNELDETFLKEIIQLSGSLSITFHKAFDEVKDWRSGMEKLIELGFKRILTSGQALNASAGIEQLIEMKNVAANRIEIMVGGGVNAKNILEIKTKVNPDAIHFSGTSMKKLGENPRYAIETLQPDLVKITEMLFALKAK
jgi:copper homeostasis protein